MDKHNHSASSICYLLPLLLRMRAPGRWLKVCCGLPGKGMPLGVAGRVAARSGRPAHFLTKGTLRTAVHEAQQVSREL